MIDPTLKNRLTGVVVLLLLAVILLPVLFDGANEQALLADTRMPVPPEVPAAGELLAPPPSIVPETESAVADAHALAEPEIPPVAVAPGMPPEDAAADIAAVEGSVAPAVVGPAAAPSSKPAAAAPQSAPPPAAAPTPAEQRLASLAEAWDVQVAAVSTLESAEQLRRKLGTAGYKARVLAAGKLFRVVVGPELRREDATILRDKLAADARFGNIKGMLVRYVP